MGRQRTSLPLFTQHCSSTYPPPPPKTGCSYLQVPDLDSATLSFLLDRFYDTLLMEDTICSSLWKTCFILKCARFAMLILCDNCVIVTCDLRKQRQILLFNILLHFDLKLFFRLINFGVLNRVVCVPQGTTEVCVFNLLLCVHMCAYVHRNNWDFSSALKQPFRFCVFSAAAAVDADGFFRFWVL